MRLSELTEDILTDELIDRLLFRGFDYLGQKAGLIMVLGSGKACEYRMPLAAEIFRGGGAPLMLLSGGKVQDTPLGQMAEYISMLKAADALGVPRGAIMTEQRSMTTEENFSMSRELIAERLPGCRSMILVTTSYHARRAVMMAAHAFPEFEIFPAAAPCGSCTRDNWKNTEKGRRTAVEEIMKLQYYASNGRIDDVDIDIA